jgi:hypothetical protein
MRLVVAFLVVAGCKDGPPRPNRELRGSETCLAELRSLDVRFDASPAKRGIATPVRMWVPIHGLRFTYDRQPRQSIVLDCELAVAVARMAGVLSDAGVVEVIDSGAYHYRCTAPATDPPRCSGSQLSSHAFGLGFDIRELVAADGARYSFLRDWVIDPPSARTCEVTAIGVKNSFLHRVVCDLFRARLFTTYLTPNYDRYHRDHLHLDVAEPRVELDHERW